MTPMMQQYQLIKANYQDAILFFRLGDFYEMFGPDAEVAAKILEIALTGRDAGAAGRIPMCGIPFHAAEGYIAKLINKGYKVAICEQVEDPKQAKGIVRRDVIRVVSPGTVMEASMLDEKGNNYVAAVKHAPNGYGLAIADISTGQFQVTEVAGDRSMDKLLDELARIKPAEILLAADDPAWVRLKTATGALLTEVSAKIYTPKVAQQTLQNHFGVAALSGFGCAALDLGLVAAGGLLKYLQEHAGGSLSHLNRITPYALNKYMMLDQATRRNLELTRNMREQDKKGSLLGILDCTVTAMGGRLLKQWLEQPLTNREQIINRQDQIEVLYQDFMMRADLREALRQVYDLERLLGRIVYGSANAKDLLMLQNSLQALPVIYALLHHQGPLENTAPLSTLAAEFDQLEDVLDLLQASINPDAPFTLREGRLIKDGYNATIDELRYISTHAKDWVAALESQERERTGIRSLKVGYNKVFGYYIEVTHANVSAVPDDYIRKQTLANAERYITPDLKEYESKILGAEEKLVALEYQVFC